MKYLVDWIGIGILVVGLVAIMAYTTSTRAEVATLTAPVADASRWVAAQAFYVTSPEGDKWVCQVGEWKEEYPPGVVALECEAVTGNTTLYFGHKDGELELVK